MAASELETFLNLYTKKMNLTGMEKSEPKEAKENILLKTKNHWYTTKDVMLVESLAIEFILVSNWLKVN